MELTLTKVYGGTLAPIDQVKELIGNECDPSKLSDFVSAIEAAKKRDGKTLDRKNYWGELALWSRRRLGELIQIAQDEGTLRSANDGLSNQRGNTELPLSLAGIGIDKMQSQRAQRIAAIPEADIKEYVAAVNFDDVVADDLIQTDRMKKWAKRSEEEVSMAGLLRFTGKTHVSNNSGNNEWYTPVEYIALAREVMGGIDLDPASSDIANKTVKAKRYHTVEDDGLAKKWKGRVWMNPPYAAPLIGMFCKKLAEEIDAGRVTQACVLVNNATETEWFSELSSRCSAILFPRSRVKFTTPGGDELGAPLQGQAFVYFGGNIDALSGGVAGFVCEVRHE